MAKREQGQEVKEERVGGWAIPIPDGAEFGGLLPGSYLSRCAEEPKETLSSKDEPQTQFQFTISDPKFPEYEGRDGFYWCSRKPRAWWNLTQTLDALGVKYEIDKENRVFKFDPMDCVGQMCRTVWAEETYQGRTRSRIQRVVSVSEKEEDLVGEEAPF